MAKLKTSLFELERKMPTSRANSARRRETTKTGLVSIEQALQGHTGNPHPVHSRSYDTGHAISLQTAHGVFPMYPQQMSANEKSHTLSDAFAGIGPYIVESFDEPAPAALASKPHVETEREAASVPGLTTPDAHCQVAAAPGPELPSPAPTAALAPEKTADDANDFEEDIKNILEQHAQRPSQPLPPEPILRKPQPEEPKPEERSKAEKASTSDPHAIFASMAAGMSNATTFDLGSMSLNRRFDEIELGIEADELRDQQKPAANSFAAAASLNDAEMLADLSAVSNLLEEKLREEQTKTALPEPLAPPSSSPKAAAPAATKAASPEPTPELTPDADPRPAVPAPVEDAPSTEPTPGAAAPEDKLRPTENPVTDTFDVTYTVPTAQATDGVSPQAAGAAMLVAWRDQNTIDMQALIEGAGNWAAYTPGIMNSGPAFFATWGMQAMDPAPLTLQQLQPILKRYGPLWLQNPAVESAIRVISGMSGDGTPGGTTIAIIDPVADAQSVRQKTNINALISQLGDGPVRVAFLAA